MDEEMTKQVTETAGRLAAAAERLERTLARLEAQQEAMEAKVERIVAAIEVHGAEKAEEKERPVRKTLPPLVSMLLSKGGVEESGARIEEGVLEKALSSLSVEQRIAVKAEMARAGLLE